MSFIAKQPNGLYCRFSSVMDCPSHYNMTEEDYIEFRIEEAKIDAKEVLENGLEPFEAVLNNFIPHIMSEETFESIVKEMSEDVI